MQASGRDLLCKVTRQVASLERANLYPLREVRVVYGVRAMLCLITSHGICSHTVRFSERHKAFSLTRVPDALVLSPNRPRLGPHQPHPSSATPPPTTSPPPPARPSHHLYTPDQESCRGPSPPGPDCPTPQEGAICTPGILLAGSATPGRLSPFLPEATTSAPAQAPPASTAYPPAACLHPLAQVHVPACHPV